MWDRIEPLMPADPARGRRWADHRGTLEAIAWKHRTNSSSVAPLVAWEDRDGHADCSVRPEEARGLYSQPRFVALAPAWKRLAAPRFCLFS
ncbi:hypothetical protein QFZ55_000041 [Streptomyces luteogriseus]|nr:hypothetical protein [Streptomyces luteogriseus]